MVSEVFPQNLGVRAQLQAGDGFLFSKMFPFSMVITRRRINECQYSSGFREGENAGAVRIKRLLI